MAQLRRLDLNDTQVSRRMVQTLRSALPQCVIIWQAFPADRTAAEKLIAFGGTVTTRDSDGKTIITLLDNLPRNPFRVVEVNLKDQSLVRDVDLACLAELTALEKLDLSGTGLTDDGLQHLRKLAHLRDFDFSKTRVNGTGLADLAAMTDLQTLRCAYSPPFTDEGLSHLPPLPQLKMWAGDLPPPVTDAALANFQRLPGLESLSIWRSSLTGEGLQHLSELSHLNNLALRSNRLENQHLTHLSKIADLRILNLSTFGNLDAEGLKHIAEVSTLARLTLSHTRLDDDGLLILAGLEKLVCLNIEGTAVTAKGLSAFKAIRPQCEVVWNAPSTSKMPPN